MRELIIRGARENNLQGVDLDLPLGQLVVLTGPSGAGKSSLALDTLHAEGRRRYLEALSASVRGGSQGLRAPAADLVSGLPPTVALEQREPPPTALETAASVAEVDRVLRVLVARAGQQHCPSCGAAIRTWSLDEIVAELLDLPEGSRLLLESPVHRSGEVSMDALLDEIGQAGFSRVRLGDTVARIEALQGRSHPADASLRVVVDRVRVGPGKGARLRDGVRTALRAGQGSLVAVVGSQERAFADRPWCTTCQRALPALEPGLLSHRGLGACSACTGTGQAQGGPCPDCGGTRLREEARAVRFAGRSLPEWLELGPGPLLEKAASWEPGPVVDAVLAELRRRLELLEGVGLEELPLSRAAATLSSGELQRLRLVRQASARLSGVLYLLDEPATGLHPQAAREVVRLLRLLVREGNSVIAVSHHPEVVRAADQVVDFGPGPGAGGGRVVFQGPVSELLEADTLTGRWLSGRERHSPPQPRQLGPRVTELGLPLGAVVALTGPSGCGKTRALTRLAAALEAGEVPAIQRVLSLDQAPLKRASRSNPATYTGLWTPLRELLSSAREARIRGFSASHFSLNLKGGRCEHCAGVGSVRVDLDVLPDAWLVCPVCEGRRFTRDVLEVRWRGLAPDELLGLRASEAASLLGGHPRLDAPLRALVRTGLGYLPLGQPGHTLSGGEARRLRLARELAAGRGATGVAYLLDDPGAGLHPADVSRLVQLFHTLVDLGATVWLATHDQALARACDVTVDLDATG